MKLGVAISNLGSSQLAYNVIKNINCLVEKQPEIDCVVYYENFVRPCFNLGFSSMQIFEAWSYDGIMICTSLSNVDKISNFPITNKRFFYVWDLEWFRGNIANFNYINKFYNNSLFKLVARSAEHKELIEDCWNTEVCGVVEDFDIDQFMKVIEDECNK
jgi:hypothetical protein